MHACLSVCMCECMFVCISCISCGDSTLPPATLFSAAFMTAGWIAGRTLEVMRAGWIADHAWSRINEKRTLQRAPGETCCFCFWPTLDLEALIVVEICLSHLYSDLALGSFTSSAQAFLAKPRFRYTLLQFQSAIAQLRKLCNCIKNRGTNSCVCVCVRCHRTSEVFLNSAGQAKFKPQAETNLIPNH